MEQELDLRALWQVIAKRWKLIVIIPLAAALISLLVSAYIITPQYTASTTIIVTRPADTSELIYRDVQLSRELVGTYREIMHSRRVLEMAIVNRSLPYSAGELREKVDVQAVRDTELFTVDVTDPDPVLARDIANEMARVFKEQVVEIMQIENVSVIDEAVTPRGPVSPRIELNVAVAFVVGLMAAFGLAFLIEYLDQSVKDPGEAQQLLEVPVIGVVPKVEGENLFARSNPRSPPAEAFRTLRTNIQYSSIDKPVKRILIAGANPACGKSTVAANLAVTLARRESSVLLIDADLRRPTIHKFFNLENEPGLSSLIFKEGLNLNEVIRKSDEEKNLYILPSGPVPPYPAEMLSSKRMEVLNEEFARRFEYIIYDSPPVIAVTDAALISRLADGTLVVLDYGVVRKDEAQSALEQFYKVHANVIGLVINNMPHSRSYYNGYQYYYSSYGDESRSKKSRVKKAVKKTIQK